MKSSAEVTNEGWGKLTLFTSNLAARMGDNGYHLLTGSATKGGADFCLWLSDDTEGNATPVSGDLGGAGE